MEIIKICGLATIGVITAITLKKNEPAISLIVIIACGLLIMFGILPSLNGITDIIESFDKIENGGQYIAIICKITGISYVAQLASQMCKDFGFGSLGTNVELAAKIMILTLCVPILQNLFLVINSLLGV